MKGLIIFLILALIPNISFSSESEDRELRIIQECEQRISSFSELTPSQKRRIEDLLSPIYESYTRMFTYIPSVEYVLTNDNIGVIQEEYNRWKNSGKLEILHKLINLLRPIKVLYPVRSNSWHGFHGPDVIGRFESELERIFKECEQLQEKGFLSKNLKQLQFVLWKLCFIEPYKDVKDHIADLETKMKPIEVAKKKEEAVNRKIAEERRKKEEERKKLLKEQEAEQQRQLRAKCEKYGVRGMVLGHEIAANPFQYEGQAVILSSVSFEKMIDRKVGVFNDLTGNQLLVSNLPSNLFTMQGQIAQLIVRVKGTTRVTNALGAAFNVPLLEYIDLYQ